MAILSQRRVVPPYGMAGGEPGQRGENLWFRKKREARSAEGSDKSAQAKPGAKSEGKSEANAEIPGIKEASNGSRADSKGEERRKEDWFSATDYDIINLGGSNQCTMHAGDRIVICTPGGGGYGPVGGEGSEKDEGKAKANSDRHIPRAQGSLANWNAAAHSN